MSNGLGGRRRFPSLLALACAGFASLTMHAAASDPVLPRESGATLSSGPHAQAVAASFAQADLRALDSIFEAGYVPAEHLDTARSQLALLERQAQLDRWPILSFDERLRLNGYESLSLDLDVGATVPLYRSILQPRAALLDHQLAAFAEESAFAKAEARTAFLRDVFSLALLRRLATEARASLERLFDTGWRPPADASEALLLPPLERDLLALSHEVEQLESFALEQMEIYQRRIGAALGLELAIPVVPDFDPLVEQLDRRPPDLETCLRDSPLVRQALVRHDELLLDWRAAASLDFRLDLLGNLSYRGGDLAASVGLEARLPLPGGWPVAGEVGAVANPQALEQSLRLSWPPPLGRRSFPDDAPAEAASRLDLELDSVEAELRELLRAERRTLGAIEERELRLLWFTRDQHGPSLADLSATRELALRPAEDPVAELQAVQLRSDLGFARLSHVEAVLDLRLLCGVG